MALAAKAYFALTEIQARFGLTRYDLAYLIENGLLTASVRVWDVFIEEGCYEQDADGAPFRLPTERRPYSGLLDLRAKDACRLFRDQGAVVEAFAAAEGEYLVVLRPEDCQSACKRDPRSASKRDPSSNSVGWKLVQVDPMPYPTRQNASSWSSGGARHVEYAFAADGSRCRWLGD